MVVLYHTSIPLSHWLTKNLSLYILCATQYRLVFLVLSRLVSLSPTAQPPIRLSTCHNTGVFIAIPFFPFFSIVNLEQSLTLPSTTVERLCSPANRLLRLDFTPVWRRLRLFTPVQTGGRQHHVIQEYHGGTNCSYWGGLSLRWRCYDTVAVMAAPDQPYRLKSRDSLFPL